MKRSHNFTATGTISTHASRVGGSRPTTPRPRAVETPIDTGLVVHLVLSVTLPQGVSLQQPLLSPIPQKMNF